MTINITPSVVVEGLQALVDVKGEDFVYNPVVLDDGVGTQCVYVLDGAPSCLVGQFLANLGVPVERLEVADMGSYGAGLPAGVLLENLRDEEVITYTDDHVCSALSEAQYAQDSGRTWGAALEEAKRIVERGF